MRLEFDSLIIDNFKSFIGAPHELVLSSFGPGVHFVRGDNQDEPRLSPNGCGKSSIFDALCWCIYGRTVAGLRNPDIKPRFATKSTRVTLFLRKDDKKHNISRGIISNSLYKDGDTAGQEDIEAFIGLNFDTFTNTVIMGQEQNLFFDLKPEAKLGLFGSALDLDRWELRSKTAALAATELEDGENKLETALITLDASQGYTEGQLERALASYKSWREDHLLVTKGREARLAWLQTEADKLEAERGKHDLDYDGAMTELLALQKSETPLKNAALELIGERSKRHGEIAPLRQQLAGWKAEILTLGSTDRCPVCDQSITGTNLERHKEELRGKMRKATTKLDRLLSEVAQLTSDHAQAANDLQVAREDIETFQAKANEARDSRDRLTPTVAKHTAEMAQIRTELKTRERAENPYTKQIQDLRGQKKGLEADKKAKAGALAQLRVEIERVRFWVKGFKEVRLLELEDVLQELELATATTLEAVGLVNWRVTYAVERETKAGTIQRGLSVFVQSPRDKAPVRWECWSGGERQRLRIVGALALSEVLLARAGVDTNLEVLDEPVSFVAASGVEDLCELLVDRAKSLQRQVWYVDHVSVDSVRFASVLTVVKDKHGSRLELE